MHLFMSHIMSSLHVLKERIFVSMCILNLFFKFGLYFFTFSTPPKSFPKLSFPKTCFVFPIFKGGVNRKTYILHRESCLYFLQSWILLYFLDSLFSLVLCSICLLFIFWLGCLHHYVKKRRNYIDEIWKSCCKGF